MRFIALLIISSSILISCQQEPDEIISQVQSQCRITTGLYYGGSGGINDSASFTYSADGKLQRVEGQDTYVLFGYTGSEITTRRWIEKFDNSLAETDTIYYDASKRITKFINWYWQDNFNPDTSRVIYSYEYANGKLKRVVEATTFYGFGGPYEDSFFNDFTWDASGNISKLVLSDLSGPFDSITYTYNTHPNYFSVVHPHFYLFEPFFQLQVGLTPHFAYFYSRNNVTGFQIYGGLDYPVSYGLDSLNKITDVNLSGDEYMKYRYQCQ